MGRSRATWEHKKGDLGIQAWIFMGFGRVSVHYFGSFSRTLDKNTCLCYACFQVTFLNDFGVWIWTSGDSKPSIWCEMGCKNQLFTEVGILMILGSFFDVFYGLGVLFCHLRVLEAGLKFDDFSVIPWETPGWEDPPIGRTNILPFWPTNTSLLTKPQAIML